MVDLGVTTDVGFDVTSDVNADLSTVSAGSVFARQTSVEVLFNGVAIPAATILAVRCQYGWDQPVSTADITLTTYPAAGGTYHDPVEVTVNGVLRFVGILGDKDYSNWPRTVVLKAKGDLCKAEEYDNQNTDLDPFMPDPGIDLFTLIGSDSGTLQQIVVAVLDICGVSYDLANFADPPHVYGLEADEEFMWKYGTTGLAYLHSLFEASAGYRLFHSGDGNLYLAQIIGRPRSGAADLTLTEGIDILDGGKMTRSVTQQRNVVIVTGWDDGDGFGPLVGIASEGTDFPPDRTFKVSSSMIETEEYAQDLAENFWLPEVNRELVTGSLSTWRDDVMGPAQSHLVLSGPEQPSSVYGEPLFPGGRLGTGEKLWVTGLTLDISEKGEFTQTPSYLGGGFEADYTPVPV